jgi:hypothetical protein
MSSNMVSEEQRVLSEKVLSYLIKILFYGAAPNVDIGSTRLVVVSDPWPGAVPQTDNDLDAFIAGSGQAGLQLTREVNSVMGEAQLLAKIAKHRNALESALQCDVLTSKVDFGEYGSCVRLELISDALDASVEITFCLIS